MCFAWLMAIIYSKFCWFCCKVNNIYFTLLKINPAKTKEIRGKKRDKLLQAGVCCGIIQTRCLEAGWQAFYLRVRPFFNGCVFSLPASHFNFAHLMEM